MEASSASQAFNTRRLTRSQVRASSSPLSSRRALADVTNDSPSRKPPTPFLKHHPNPSSNINPNPNLDPISYPNPNPELVLNSNPNPNPNPSPNPSSNPNSNLNPNPNPDPNLNSNPISNPNPNLYSNPNPNSNPSSKFNPIPNPSLSPNPNPDSNPDLSLYSNPNLGREEELQTNVKKAVENSSNTKCRETLVDSVNPSSSPSPNMGQSLSTGGEEEGGGKDGLQRAAEKACCDSYEPPVAAVKQYEDCIEKCAASSVRRPAEPQISGFEHDDDDSDDGSDWSVLVNTPSLQGDTDPDKSPPPTIPNRLILTRHCHHDYEILANSSYCYYHLHKTASEQSSNTIKHNNNTNNTNNGEEYADSGTFYGLHKEEQENVEINDDDDYYEELCRGMKGVSVEENEEDEEYEEEEEEESNNPWMVQVSKPLPEHKGKHIRFVYSGDGEEIVEEECALSASSSSRERSPGVLCLRGLPAPIGKHLRFTEEEEEKGEEIQRVQ